MYLSQMVSFSIFMHLNYTRVKSRFRFLLKTENDIDTIDNLFVKKLFFAYGGDWGDVPP